MAGKAVNKKILDFLRENPKYSYNAPTLQRHLKENLTTIRCELRRLCEQKKIIREQHGFYRYKLDAEALFYLENPPTLLHGIMVSMRIMQKDILGISARLCEKGFERTSGRNRNRWVCSFFYELDVLRKVTVTVHGNGRVDLYFNCSQHPVSYFEFRDMLKFCEGKLDFLGPFGEQRVVEFGLAKDFREIRMSGVHELSLKVFLNHWYRVYRKDSLGVTRVEQHVCCDVPVSVLLDLFERMFLPVCNGSVRVDEFKEVV